MGLVVEVKFKVDIWDKTFLKKTEVLPYSKAVITDQGLDRMGDKSWITGLHLGDTVGELYEASTAISNPKVYVSTIKEDKSYTEVTEDFIEYTREVRFDSDRDNMPDGLKQISLSWDMDVKTSVALLGVDIRKLAENEEYRVYCKVVVKQSLLDTRQGVIDLGASEHQYVMKPSAVGSLKDTYIGSKLSQFRGKMFTGSIPDNILIEPEDSVDANVAVFDGYVFDSRNKVFRNYFSISSRNAETRTVVTQTIGIPSSYAIEFTPPISKGENKELELEFRINWTRG